MTFTMSMIGIVSEDMTNRAQQQLTGVKEEARCFRGIPGTCEHFFMVSVKPHWVCVKSTSRLGGEGGLELGIGTGSF